MSKKNHQKVGEKLIRTDKKYSHLKLKQKEKIYAWMLEEAKHYYDRTGKYPGKKAEDTAVVDVVYDRIEKAGIWIPYGEVFKHYKSIKAKLRRRICCRVDEGEKIHSQHF